MKNYTIVVLVLFGLASCYSKDESVTFRFQQDIKIDSMSFTGGTLSLPGGIEIPADSISFKNGVMHSRGDVAFYIHQDSMKAILSFSFLISLGLLILSGILYWIYDAVHWGVSPMGSDYDDPLLQRTTLFLVRFFLLVGAVGFLLSIFSFLGFLGYS